MEPFRQQDKFKYPVVAFDGGLNTKFSPVAIADNESPDLYNVVFDSKGAVATREGFGKFNTTAVGNYSCDGLFSYKKNTGTQLMCGWWNGTMYNTTGTVDTTFVTVPSAQGVFTASYPVEFAEFQNLAFMCDGSNVPYKYNGTEFTRHGIYTATAGFNILQGGAGTLNTGYYFYKLAWVNSYGVVGQAALCASSTTMSGVSCASVNLPIAPTSYGISARWLYRTSALVSSAPANFYYVTAINDNTTTSVVDNYGDAALGSAMPATSTKGVPAAWDKAVAHKERLFYFENSTNPQYVWYSHYTEPYNFPATNYGLFSDGDGEKIIDIGTIGDDLLVVKDNSLYIWYMPDASDSTSWQIKKVAAQIGGAALRGMTGDTNFKVLLGMKNGQISGFHLLTPQGVEQFSQAGEYMGSVTTDIISERIEPELFNISTSNLSKIASCTFKNKMYWVAYYTTEPYYRIYCIDLTKRSVEGQLGAWTRFKGINAACFAYHNSKLYFASASATGRVYELFNSTYSDDGTAIDSYYKTKEYGGDISYEDYWKDFRYIHINHDKANTSVNQAMGFTSVADDLGGGSNDVALSATVGTYYWESAASGATFVWGGGVWAASYSVVPRGETTLYTPLTGKKIQFTFDNKATNNYTFKVHKLNMYMNIRGAR